MISIIIPVFNSENTIEILVDSIVKILEKHYDFEIVLVNDLSKDKTEEKCKKLADKYSNISTDARNENDTGRWFYRH